MSHPSADRLREFFRSHPLPAASIEEMRSAFTEITRVNPLPPDVAGASVDAGGVPAVWLSAPGVAEDRAVLFLHGGGFAIGSSESHAELAARLAGAAGARALVIDYRLAPEHPHPAAVEDAVSAYRFLLAGGAAPSRLAVAGDSAGGGLALATLVALRDRGLPLPAAAVCFSPWTDLEVTGASITGNAGKDPLIPDGGLPLMASLYLAGADARAPLASPLHADLAGLPPLFLQVGTDEVLLDDARRMAERARAAGVQVVLDEWEGMIHGFQAFPAILDEARRATDRAAAFLRERMR